MYYRNNRISINNKSDDIICQIIDWKTNKELQIDEEQSEESESDEMLSYDIHLFGVTNKKESIHIKVTGFNPYFYVEIPNDWGLMNVNRLVSKLKDILKEKGLQKIAQSLVSHKITEKYKLYGFTNKKLFKFVKLVFNNKEAFNAYKNLFYKKIQILGVGFKKYELYETNIEPFLRFMHSKDLDSCGWIKLPATKYKMNNKETTCQIDITCKYNSVEKYETKESAKIIQAAFDIECTSGDGDFPQASRPDDKIIQIGTTVREYGETGFLLKHIITLGSCSEIEGAVVESYDTEKEVLLAWTKLIQQLDPDILYGYNIFGFDFKYMYNRAELLGCEYRFSQLSKVKDLVCKLETKKLSSSALGDNIMYLPFLPGRISIDIMKIVQRDHKLTSYKLDNVAKEFIQDEKDDVTPAQIFAFQKGTADDRRTIAKYCIQDCALLNDLSDKLNILTNNLGMANVCSVPLEYIIMRGQGIKVFSLVAKFCREHNYLIPVISCGELFNKWCNEQGYKKIYVNKEIDDKYEIAEKMAELDKRKTEFNETCKYEGATVFEPQIGFHKYVVVKDFKSLYPSEMIASNLSHDTYVEEGSEYDNLPGVTYKNMSYQNPVTNEIVTDRWAQIKHDPSKPDNEQDRGIIPLILIKLLAERSKFKKLMAKEQDPFQKSVLDGVQLALKVTCNSVYGQCGASTSSIYFKPVAASTTAGGRAQLEHAKEFVEKNHPGAECVYGDTDSIFVDFKVDETNKTEKEVLQEAINLGIEYGERITQAIGVYPHELEYEKTFCPLILMSKKRYVGKLYEFDVNKFKRKSMGDASKRRDYAPIVKTIYNGMVDILLNELDEEKAVTFILKETEKLLNGEQPKSDFVISKTLKAKYKNRESIGHAVLADRMKVRDPGNAPQVNDRVPFVYVECFDKGKKVGDNMENPEYAEQNSIKIDYLYYLERQIMNPVCQILDILVANSKELFSDAIKQELRNRKDKIEQCNRKLKNTKNNQSEISSFFGNDYKPKVKQNIPITVAVPSEIKLKNKIEEKITDNMSKDEKEVLTMYNWLTGGAKL